MSNNLTANDDLNTEEPNGHADSTLSTRRSTSGHQDRKVYIKA